MSCNYADGLSPYDNKGKLGLAEKFDSEEQVNEKVLQLAKWLTEAQHVVVHTGAGISTSAGIPDFRGPNGVWTLEAKGLKPEKNIAFDEAIPTKTHMALVKLVELGVVQYVISQNIDGLHLRSGLPRRHLAELHGNMYIEQCNQCSKQFVRGSSTTSVGQKCLGKPCPAARGNGRPCRGRLHDTILDWEHNLPESDLKMSDYHSSVADLSLCLGTTLQIVPSGNLPVATKKCNGRLIICNLQPTKHDRKADLIINSYVDEIMMKVMKSLELSMPIYNPVLDPSIKVRTNKVKNSYIEWTIESELLIQMKALYECKRKQPVRRNGKRKKNGVLCVKVSKTESDETARVNDLNAESNTDEKGVQTFVKLCKTEGTSDAIEIAHTVTLDLDGESNQDNPVQTFVQLFKKEGTSDITEMTPTVRLDQDGEGNEQDEHTCVEVCKTETMNDEAHATTTVNLD